MSASINPSVEEGIADLRNSFPEYTMLIESDGQGGAFVTIEGVDLGASYSPSTTWVGFQITFQYPFSDVYPHYIRPDVVRKDGRHLTSPFHPNNRFAPPTNPRAAIMVSRRSNRRDPGQETAAIKLAKVLEWIRAQ